MNVRTRSLPPGESGAVPVTFPSTSVTVTNVIGLGHSLRRCRRRRVPGPVGPPSTDVDSRRDPSRPRPWAQPSTSEERTGQIKITRGVRRRRPSCVFLSGFATSGLRGSGRNSGPGGWEGPYSPVGTPGRRGAGPSREVRRPRLLPKLGSVTVDQPPSYPRDHPRWPRPPPPLAQPHSR